MTSIKEYLEEKAREINTPAFIENDPVQFPRRYTLLQDIEIVAFITATISWGKRRMILNSAERMLAGMGDSPYSFVMNEGYKTLGAGNIHRTFFEPDLAWMLRGFKHIYERHESLEAFLRNSIGGSAMPAWDMVRVLSGVMTAANGGSFNKKCFPANYERAALKRINLALRWLVRNDGIVDMGVWTFISPKRLYIPLDVHVGDNARKLGILSRKANDRRAVEMLTAQLVEYCPDDPIKYDFALFGDVR
jgi:uncharacterized protein (TIGR02757 family)